MTTLIHKSFSVTLVISLGWISQNRIKPNSTELSLKCMSRMCRWTTWARNTVYNIRICASQSMLWKTFLELEFLKNQLVTNSTKIKWIEFLNFNSLSSKYFLISGTCLRLPIIIPSKYQMNN